MINLSPFDIILKKGDTIGQGILKKYYITDDDVAQGERTGGFGSTSKINIDKFLEVGNQEPIDPYDLKRILRHG